MSTADPFWNLIQTDGGKIDEEIQAETIKRIVRACVSTTGIQLNKTSGIEDTVSATCNKLHTYTATQRSKSAPPTPRGRLKKNGAGRNKRRVHFEEMEQSESTHISTSTGPGQPPDAATSSHSNEMIEDNKENINSNITIDTSLTSLTQNKEDNVAESKDKASVKFRWAATKGLPAHILVVHLRVPFLQKLITMRWKKDSSIFESDELHGIPVGRHKASLLIANREISTEPLDIKFYTFEADVYLSEEEENQLYKDRHVLGQLKGKDTSHQQATSVFDKRPTLRENAKILDILDVGNDNMNSGSERKKLPAGCKSNLNNSKEFDKLNTIKRDQTYENSNDNGTDTGIIPNGFYKNVNESVSEATEHMPKGFKVPQFNKFSSKSKNHTSGKMEDDTVIKGERSSIRRSKIYEKLVAKQLMHKDRNDRSDNVDYNDRHHSDRNSHEYDSRHSLGSKRNSNNEVPRHDNFHHEEREDQRNHYYTNKSSSNSRERDNHNIHSSTYSEAYEKEHWNSRNGTEAASSKLTRSGAGVFHSEQELRYNDHHSYQDRGHNDFSTRRSNEQLDNISSVGSGLGMDRSRERYRSLDQLSDITHGNNSSRERSERDRRSCDRYSDSDYSGRDTRHRSADSNRQKESGYYSDTGHSDSVHERMDTRNDHSMERYYSDTDVRSNSARQKEYGAEDRSSRVTFEKDYERDRQPHIRAPLVTTRTTRLMNKTGTGRGTVNGDDRTKEERMQDLEETVLSLKRVLTDREKELELVKIDKNKLESDVRELRDHSETGVPGSSGLVIGHGPVLETQKETERRINQLIREKENMATEIWQLKRDLDRLQKGQVVPRRDDYDDSDSHNLDHFDSNNPRILQIKIEEQDGQIKDLQEVNEKTANNLIHTEKELDQLKRENEVLRKSRSRSVINLEDENKSLKQQIEQLNLLGGGSDTEYLRKETEHLREDLRILRDKNHQLIQDNIKLTEHLKDLEIRSERSTSRTGIEVDEDHDELVAQCKRYRKEREAALEEVDFLRKQLQKNRRDGSLNRTREKDFYQSESSLFDDQRDKLHRSTYQSSSALVNGHDSRRRDRKHSGSDMSDSTAVLTTAHPGFHSSDHNTPNSLPKLSDTRPSNNTNIFDDEVREVHTNDTVDDVLDDLPPVRSFKITSKGKFQPKLSVVEDVVGSNESLEVKDIENDTHAVNYNKLNININNDYRRNTHTVNSLDYLVSNRRKQNLHANSHPVRLDHNDLQSEKNIVVDVQSDQLPSANMSNRNREFDSDLVQSNPKLLFTKSNVQSMNHIKVPAEDQVSDVSSTASSSKCNFHNGKNYTTNLSCNNNNKKITDDKIANCVIDTSTTISNNDNNFIPVDHTHSFNPIEHPRTSSASHNINRTLKPSPHQDPQSSSSFQHSSVSLQTLNCSSIHPFVDISSITGDNNCETESTLCLNDEISEMDSISCVGINPKSIVDNKYRMIQSNVLSSSITPSFKGPEVTFTSNYRKRSNSVNSDCTDFLMGDVEQMVQNITTQHQSMKEYSTSMTNLATTNQTTNQQPHTTHSNHNVTSLSNLETGSDRLSPHPEPLHNSSLRSVSPTLVVTQHNKHLLGSPADDKSLLMANRKPFCPRSAGDMQLEDLVKFSRQGGKISRGIVKYVGHLPGKNDTYLGVELEHEIGKHDGLYDGQRYFQCKPNKGVFVAFSKVVMAWGSS